MVSFNLFSIALPCTDSSASRRAQLLIQSLRPFCSFLNDTSADYDIFVTQKPSSIALGSIISVINRVGVELPDEERATFLFKLKMRFNLGESNPDVVMFRGRLNSIYYRAQQTNEPASNTNGRDTPVSNEKVIHDYSNPSPTCVDVGVSLPSRKLFLMRSRLSSRSAEEDAEDAALNDRPWKRARASCL